MTKASTLTLILALLVTSSGAAFGQAVAEQEAVDHAVRLQADQIALRHKLEAARAARERHDFATAATLYGDAWKLVQEIGPNVEQEAAETQAGVAATRLPLAQAAQSRGDLREANRQVSEVLRIDPTNADAIGFKAGNDKRLHDLAGKTPSEDAVAQIPTIVSNRVAASTLVQDGKLFYEMGQLDAAEAKLRQAVKENPADQSAYYYLNLIREARFNEALNKRDIESRKSMVEVENDWATPPKRDVLPQPNPYARVNLIHTSPGRQEIMDKLDRIRLDEVNWDGTPLTAVIDDLSAKAKSRDPKKRGLNFIISATVDSGAAAAAAPTLNPATGLPEAPAAPAEPQDMSSILIHLKPSLNDVRLADVLDAIVKASSVPIKFSIEDYAIVFSLKGREIIPIYSRIFKVDPNTFLQGLESVVGFPFGTTTTGGGGGGGGQAGTQTVPRVALTSSVGGGGGGGGGGAGGQGGNGIVGVTRTNTMLSVQQTVQRFFTTMGVDLATPPRTVFFNDRDGTLFVRASLQDLDIIETAVQVLNIAPPEVNIKTKFVEVGQIDSRALGFDWYLGNLLMNGGSIIGSGGTAPSFTGAPSTANPEGTFPGSAAAGTALPQSISDQLITGGLRSSINTPSGSQSFPTVGTFTGILTDPQFRVVIHALEQRDGSDLLNESSVTTLSGRQTQIQVVDLRTIVTGVNANQNVSGGAGTLGATSAGAIGSTINYPTDTLPFGPTLDVVPYVSADGFTIQMTIIPTFTEFLGYDPPGAFVPQAQSVSGTGGSGIPLTAQLPLPHFRVRQVTTSAIVWDGQTVVLGGLISEDVTKLKDKVPVLGDLPLVGRLFRSEASHSEKKNLVIFVTPTIIDPAGNRFHSEDEMPFSANAIPQQKPIMPPSHVP